MASEVFYKASAARDLKALERPIVSRLMAKLERVLAENSRAGEPLHGSFEGLWRYRIGDYRVIYALIPEGVLVLRLIHRREAYRSRR